MTTKPTLDEVPVDDAPLHLRYRPQDFDEVVGQDDVVKALESILKGKRKPHSYLLLGPSGIGKTTLGRIIAKEVGCSPPGIIEIDAAVFSGVDDTRRLVELMEYRAIAETPQKAVILDECHRLSLAAWSSLLKATEEPRKHAFWVFCTTDGDKVPNTIKTRCHIVELRRIRTATIREYLEAVCEWESMTVDPDTLQVCAREANGSMRQALVFLNAVAECPDAETARRVIRAVEESEDLGLFLKQLTAGTLRWQDALFHIKGFNKKGESAEGIRLKVLNYVQKVLLDTRDEAKSRKLLTILTAFMRPCGNSEGMAPIIVAVGSVLQKEQP